MSETAKRPPGRPRQFPEVGSSDGAPKLTLRLTPDLLAQVREAGGAAWVRGLIERELAAR